jgi:hypothetical protein
MFAPALRMSFQEDEMATELKATCGKPWLDVRCAIRQRTMVFDEAKHSGRALVRTQRMLIQSLRRVV